MLKMASFNINGLRAVTREHFWPWLEQEQPDLLFMQEIKASPDQLDDHLIEPEQYDAYYFPAERPGYSGVAVWINHRIKSRVKEVGIGLGIQKFDCEGRSVYVDIDDLSIWGAYFPNGQRDHNRVPYKLEFSKKIFEAALAHARKNNLKAIICGDVNTAHQEIDLSNPKENKETTGFLPIEREFISSVLENDFIDCFRHLHPNTTGAYTWWTYRNDCRNRNIGWRIDYFLAEKSLSERLLTMEHRTKILGSDHCPIVLEINSPL